MSKPSISPRPILKRSTASPPSQHGVHFPPTQHLTSIYSAYSAAAYDRSPIVVAPNSCTLPERGCPGRTYTLDDPASPTSPRSRSYAKGLHPRAMPSSSLADTERSAYSVPALIPDLSSESDESDGFVPLEASISIPPKHQIHGLTIHHESYTSVNGYHQSTSAITALSFLPYSPHSPAQPDDSIPKPKRRPDRKAHDSSVDHDRIRKSCQASSRSSSRIRTYTHHKSLTASFSGSTLNDDGCLGGF